MPAEHGSDGQNPVRLRAMRLDEFDAFLATSAADYRADIIRAWGASPEAADEKVANDFAKLRARGPQSDDETVYVVERVADGVSVGALWLNASTQSNRRTAFIYDIRIDDEHRGTGLGRATLAAAEAWAREKGAERLGLHVFGDNDVARRLYRTSGFVETSVQMSKALEPTGSSSPAWPPVA